MAETFYGEDRALADASGHVGASRCRCSPRVAFYGCYALMAVGAARGELSLGDMTLYMVAFRQGQQAFQSILSRSAACTRTTSTCRTCSHSSTVPLSEKAPTSAKLRRARAGDCWHNGSGAPRSPAGELGIRFERVGFRYPGKEEWALRDVDLFIPRGQSLALVGQNGAGKTTFIKLLTRLYEPTEGRVLLDGNDLREHDEAELRAQHRRHLPGLQPVPAARARERRLRQRRAPATTTLSSGAPSRAAARAEVVAALKGGLETPLGRWFHDGVELSGGQWQKIALARAFMREEADILVLDEPTAALDAEAEHAVFERFRRLTEGRTSILISHRFPTVRMADRILVIEKGRVVEEGTHGELVAADGRYARLFSLQAQGYL